jgi:hypothetical protein
VAAIEEELVKALGALAPHAQLAPVPLMSALAELLRKQVAALSVGTGS